MPIDTIVRKLSDEFGSHLSAPTVFRGETTLLLLDSRLINRVCAFAKQPLGFDFLLDISSVDEGERSPRFTLVYELYGLEHHLHLRLKTQVTEASPSLPSVTPVWRGAEWHEREIFDMMGIRFEGHPDLRRILMWEGYPWHPLRKDFPLAGKSTQLPEIAFTEPAPLAGGPFVTTPGGRDTIEREPRARIPD